MHPGSGQNKAPGGFENVKSDATVDCNYDHMSDAMRMSPF